MPEATATLAFDGRAYGLRGCGRESAVFFLLFGSEPGNIIFKARSREIHEEFVPIEAYVCCCCCRVGVLEGMVSRVETYVIAVPAGQLAIQKSTKTWTAE